MECPECGYSPMDYDGVWGSPDDYLESLEIWVCPACEHTQVNVLTEDVQIEK